MYLLPVFQGSLWNLVVASKYMEYNMQLEFNHYHIKLDTKMIIYSYNND
jgi:hypothetical protein